VIELVMPGVQWIASAKLRRSVIGAHATDAAKMSVRVGRYVA
jgi:hypothetical protein